MSTTTSAGIIDGVSPSGRALLFEEQPLLLNDGVEIIGEREGGLLECYIDIGLIDTEDVAVSAEHVTELARSMRDEQERKDTESGQLSPVLLGLIEGEGQLKIIDGFHRTSALKEAGISKVFATIRQSTWEEVIDLRILTARTHKTVQFARVVEWVTDAWGRTVWASKISASQAFVLHNSFSSGKNLGVIEEAEEIKAWVERKCNQWQVAASTIYSNLAVAALADPALVQEARQQKHGKALEYITPGHLKVIALGVPNRHDIQNLIATAARQYNLHIPQTRKLTNMLSHASSHAEALRMIEMLDLSSIEPEFAKTKSRELAAVEPRDTTGELEPEGVLQDIDRALTRAEGLLTGSTDAHTPMTKEELALVVANFRRVGERVLGILKGLDDISKRNVDTLPSSDNLSSKRAATTQPRTTTPLRRRRVATQEATEPSIAEDTFDAEDPIVQYLLGMGGFPIIAGKEDALRAEHILKKLPPGSDIERAEDIRDAIAQQKRH